MNFAWYSKTPTASFRVATDAAMIQLVQEQTITGQAAVKDSENTQYYSCKATASNLKPGTYYYQIGNQATTPFKVQDSSDGFSFIYVGDPQIGLPIPQRDRTHRSFMPHSPPLSVTTPSTGAPR